MYTKDEVYVQSFRVQEELNKFILQFIEVGYDPKNSLRDRNIVLRQMKNYIKRLPIAKSSVCDVITNQMIEMYKKSDVSVGKLLSGLKYDSTIINDYERIKKLIPRSMVESLNNLNQEINRMVLDGNLTYNDASKIIIESSGYKGVQFNNNGRNWRFDTLVNRMVRDNLRTFTLAIGDEIAEDLQTDIFQITSHANAREKCSKDQGKLVSEKNGVFKDLNGRNTPVYAWSETSFGEPDGLFGYNCRHFKVPKVQGLSVPKNFDPIKKEIINLDRASRKYYTTDRQVKS